MRVLVVGNGFAGSQLAYYLAEKIDDVTVLSHHDYQTTCSTAVSAGIMLPFTGRRKVLSFKAEQILPFALEHYRRLESDTGIRLLRDISVIQWIRDAGEYNDWVAKSAAESTGKFLGTINLGGKIIGLKPAFGHVQLTYSTAVISLQLLRAVKENSKRIRYLNHPFDFENFKVTTSVSFYRNDAFDKVIFCEGFRVSQNPFWHALPFMPVKGEIIEIYAPKLELDCIYNGSIYIIPLGSYRFMVGATYNWKDIDELPSEEGLTQLKRELDLVLDCEYTVSSHAAGIRPAIQDRRPVIGFHPLYPTIGIFNGLGTKGAMLAPFYAKQLSDHIIDGKSIDEDVDVGRFKDLLVHNQ